MSARAFIICWDFENGDGADGLPENGFFVECFCFRKAIIEFIASNNSKIQLRTTGIKIKETKRGVIGAFKYCDFEIQITPYEGQVTATRAVRVYCVREPSYEGQRKPQKRQIKATVSSAE